MNSRYATIIIIFMYVGIIGCSKKTSGINWNFLDKNKLDVQEANFEYFSGKAKINYKDDELDIKARANVRIRKDSVIWISFSSVGIQGARCLINKDSITIINLVKKEYYVFNYDSLTKQFNFEVNYDAIQAATFGNLIKSRDKSDVVEKEEGLYILKQTSGNVSIDNFVNPKTMKIERVEMTEDSTKNTAVIRYYDFQMVDQSAFPYSAILSIFYKKGVKMLNTVIEMEYSKAELGDKELKFPFNIPKKYERK
ncbi:DUF4292 domain-containing protein [Fulvivirga sedimenti]|uniref:DUF4292 domain-containing protein n=1 Tax=Fulvivirga sedimenti TaxID=2879465 RepID=A0A9X1HTL1_9BACT|nr:DUF4292 domain-containing protein [Fulvivirga sedimenti]MCA6078069.1 DUF4292 domain-containing protein [Fulvivirga sedimenti]